MTNFVDTPSPEANLAGLDWTGFKGIQINKQWLPGDQDLIYTAMGVYDGDGDMDDDAREQIIERLLAAWQATSAGIEQASNQLVDGGELLLQAEAVITEMTTLMQAAKDVIASASDSYKKRNGHRASFEDDTGEKCWIVPFDAFEGLRSSVAALATSTEENSNG